MTDIKKEDGYLLKRVNISLIQFTNKNGLVLLNSTENKKPLLGNKRLKATQTNSI